VLKIDRIPGTDVIWKVLTCIADPELFSYPDMEFEVSDLDPAQDPELFDKNHQQNSQCDIFTTAFPYKLF
jgi:hypothetical protein